jgi:hypothetical protein
MREWRALTALALSLCTHATTGALVLERGASFSEAVVRLQPDARRGRGTDVPTLAAPGVDAVAEMSRSPNGQWQRWAAAPELVVLTAVMELPPVDGRPARATSDRVGDAEVDRLVDDLTRGLRLLTGGVFDRFGAVRREHVVPGTHVAILRPGSIVVGRFADVHATKRAIGFGGRRIRADGFIASAVLILDREYDERGALRHLLRVHELGHALGYHHVASRVSIMNERIGPEPTGIDREIARMTYAAPE